MALVDDYCTNYLFGNTVIYDQDENYTVLNIMEVYSFIKQEFRKSLNEFLLGPNDYSNWTFTYTHNYHLIITGMNELTSKITCNHDSAAVGNVTTKY